MINVKYLVLFMIGIFLALGLGIMVGITLENQNIIENQQTQLIHQIEDHFVSVRTESEQMKLELGSLEDQKSQLQELSSLLVNELIQDKLMGIHVGLITFSNQAPMKDLADYLDLAGVSIQSMITVSCDNNTNDQTMVNTLQQPDETIAAIVQELIYSVNCGSFTPLIQEAVDLMMISHAGYFELPVDYIILMGQGGSTHEYDNILIENAIEANIPIIVVETNEFDYNTLSKYSSLGISTVDNIETTYGKLALVSILSGNKGNFSFSPEGLDMLPTPIINQDLQTNPKGEYTIQGEERQ